MDFKGFFSQFFGHEVLKKILTGFGTAVHEEGIKALKANLFGIGTTDETLTAAAFEIAVRELGVDVQNAVRVAKVLSEYPLAIKNKLTNVVGHDEQELNEETETGQGDKKIITKKKIITNMRGARLILLLSKMKDEEMRTFLKGIDATTTVSARLKENLEFIPRGLDELDKSTLKTKAEVFRDEQRAKYEAEKAKYEARKKRR